MSGGISRIRRKGNPAKMKQKDYDSLGRDRGARHAEIKEAMCGLRCQGLHLRVMLEGRSWSRSSNPRVPFIVGSPSYYKQRRQIYRRLSRPPDSPRDYQSAVFGGVGLNALVGPCRSMSRNGDHR